MKTILKTFISRAALPSNATLAGFRSATAFLLIATVLTTVVVGQKTPQPRRKTRMNSAVRTVAKTTLSPAAITTSYGEDFDDFSLLVGNGWFFQNNSTTIGPGDWAQGDGGFFPAQIGTSNAFAGCTYDSGVNPGNVSNWMVSPTFTIANGDEVEFWTRAAGAASDRVEVRLSTNGTSTNVGSTDSDTGDFTTLLLSINPTMTPSGYPSTWTRYSATVSGLSGPTDGRIGFRYYVTDSGVGGPNGDYIGVDSFRFYKSQAVRTAITEHFDNVPGLIQSGWYFRNNSAPMGNRTWLQGNSTIFSSQSLLPESFVGAGFESGSGASDISDWMLTPPVQLKNGDQIKFWTRTVTAPQYADRLEVRLSTNGNSTNVGTLSSDVGDFTTLLQTINPSLTLIDYPNAWTEYTLTVSGLPTVLTGRIGFRYYVTDGGLDGTNSDYIGIDNFRYQSLAPTAANAEISGALRTANGQGIPRAVVTLTDQSGNVRTATTNNFGRYKFTDIATGETYIISGASRKVTFNSRVFELTDNLTDFDLVAND